VAINFSVHKKLDFGCGLYIAGSSPALCDWSKKEAHRMQWTEGNNWNITLDEKEDPFPEQFEYKYLIRPDNEEEGGVFEEGPNRRLNLNTEQWKSDVTPFFMLRVGDNWEDKECHQVTQEPFMQETIGETYQEYTLTHNKELNVQ